MTDTRPASAAGHGAIEPGSAHRGLARRGPIVIAHRGASGYRPEHTLEAYRLAIRQGADFIEPDLVVTRDGVLVARHENEISDTTDVAAHPGFAHRRTTKTIDGNLITGWFTEDFTLAELKTLRATERIPAIRPDNARFDGMYAIPTFAEVLQLAKRESRNGRVVGVYPETKHPTWFAREGRRLDGRLIATSLGAKLVEALVDEDFTDPRRVYIQSFEVANLIELKRTIMPAAGVDFPLVQLYGELDSAMPYDIAYNARTAGDLGATYGGLVEQVEGGLDGRTRYRALATGAVFHWMKTHYADGIGPRKADVLPEAAMRGCGDTATPRDPVWMPRMLAHALAAGLVVHPYTLRAEKEFLTPARNGTTWTVVDEGMQLLGLGVQGFFIDQPDLGVAARARFLELGDLSG